MSKKKKRINGPAPPEQQQPQPQTITLDATQRLELLFHEIRQLVQRQQQAIQQLTTFGQQKQAEAEQLRRQLHGEKAPADKEIPAEP